jgi:HK97 family phage prohead protease
MTLDEKPRVETSRPPIEFRHAAIADVRFADRIAEIVVVPYEEEAIIEYRGEIWEESFARGAFDGIETRPEHKRPRANRDHNKSRTVGVSVRSYPSRIEGLVSEVHVAPTDLGEETLELLNMGALSASAGFGVKGSWQVLNRPKRLIKKAYLDHIAFVESPAYEGARVLAVREEDEQLRAAELSPLHTPNLDEVLAWMYSRQE